MKRLQENRIELLSKYLQTTKLDPELFPEILDHLACEAEEGLWDGKSFEHAYHGIVEAADPKTLLYLSAETKHLLAMNKSLNDIVFEGRNKLYGAYALRKGYRQTMQRSVLLGVTLFLLMVMLPNLYARLVPEKKPGDIAYVYELSDLNIKPEEKLAVPKVEPRPAQPAEKTIKSTIVEVVPDEEVDVEYAPPTIDELSSAKPGAVTFDSEDIGADIIAPPASSGSALTRSPIELEPEAEKEFTNVEQNPQYMGGNAAMSAFLQKNLRYPSGASRADIQGKVFVQFTVGADGKIENVKTIKGIGYGCDEEAERVVKLMPAWSPGKQAGRPVRVRYTLPIAFQLN